MEDVTLPQHYPSLKREEIRVVREAYVKEQKGLCAYCQTPLVEEPAAHIQAAWIDESLFPPTMFKFPIHLHHNHDTGMTIGAVHARCNAYAWQYEGE